MNNFQLSLKNLARPFETVLDRIQRRFRRSRPGSVLIMVVALLVLLALMGTAYVSTARLDRLGSAPLTFQASLDDTLTELLQTQVDALQQRIVADQEYQTGVSGSLPPPPASPPIIVVLPSPGAPSPEPTRYLANRTPQFFPIYFQPGTNPLPLTDGYLNQTAVPFNSIKTAGTAIPITGAGAAQIPLARQVAWRNISRPSSGTLFDTPFTSPRVLAVPPFASPQLKYPILQWSADDDMKAQYNYWMVPTNIALKYPAGAGGAVPTSEELYGRTRVFPAFNRYRYETIGGTTNLYIDPNGPYLAADASGAGVADAGLIQINPTPLNGLTFYYAVRVVDNSSGLNINAHWAPGSDVGPSVSTATVVDSNNFHPGAVDAEGTMQRARGFTEMESTGGTSVMKEWLNQFTAAPTLPINEAGASRGDFSFRTPAEALWSQYTSRLAYTGRYNAGAGGKRFGLPTPAGTRAFGPEDQAALAYRGGSMINPDLSRSHVENTFYTALNATPPVFPVVSVPDSMYGMSMNFVDNKSSDNFKFVTARDVHYWFDYNYNWEGITDNTPVWYNTMPAPFNTAATGGIGSALGFTHLSSTRVPPVPGARFRSPRALIDAYGPISNRANANVADLVTLFAAMPALKKGGAPALYDWMEPYLGSAVPKVSLNTAQFPELWRGFFETMIDTNTLPLKAVGEVFKVPGTLPGNLPGPLYESKMAFRNSIRNNAGTGDSATGSNNWNVKFDKYNQLLLRSAVAAVNAIDIRDGDGLVGQNKVGNNTTKRIQLDAMIGGTQTPVEVTVYGTESQPFITEVYVNTDTVTKDGAGAINQYGFIAIELYNPYPFPIKLSQYRLAVLHRQAGGDMKLEEIKLATPDLALVTIAAGKFAVLHNYLGGGADAAKYIPKSFNKTLTILGPGLPADFHPIHDLTTALEGGVGLGKGGELILLRSHHGETPAPPAIGNDGSWNEAFIEDWVPVDAFDFSGLTLADPKVAYDWHYARIASSLPSDAWKCVYPGKYTLTGTPRLVDTDVSTPWDPTIGGGGPGSVDPWEATMGDPKTKGHLFGKDKVKATPLQATVVNPYPGIQLNNFNWGNKPTIGGANRYPFGGFARVGDVMQVPFIGSYRIRTLANTSTGKPFVELTPVTMDSMFVDDADPSDDAVEQLGRFCPVRLRKPIAGLATSIDDLNPFGTYDRTRAPFPLANQTVPHWRYRWTTKIFDEFTVIANPNDDYLPNIDPLFDPADPAGTTKYPGAKPAPQPNSKAATGAGLANNGREDGAPIEGLININTAPWRVLAAMQMIPNSKDGNALYPGPFPNPQNLTYNEMLAKFIVYYRDVDDGMLHDDSTPPQALPHPHGPFQNLAELNAVFDPASWDAANGRYAVTFQNALNLLTGTTNVDATWGNLASGTAPSGTTNNHMADDDFELGYLMLNRISNLVTTRSDTFTAYVMVQGWKNVNTALPELVVQKRAAFILDRSASNPTTASFKTFSVETR